MAEHTRSLNGNGKHIWRGIIIAILGAAFSLLIVITLNRYNFLAAAIALALGALIYFLSARRLLNQTV